MGLFIVLELYQTKKKEEKKFNKVSKEYRQ